MLTYTPPEHSTPPSASERPWLLLLLVFVWLWPGVFAHDLWAPQEPQLFSVVEQWRAQPDGSVLPTLFGEAHWPAAPLWVWLAALCQSLLSPWLLDAYEATRLAGVLLTVLAFCCVGGAAREWFGRRHGRTAVLVLIGCPGLLMPVHLMSSMPVWLAGAALVFYGLSLARRRAMMASLMLAAGWLVLSLSGSFLFTLLLMALAIGLLCNRHWQFRRYRLVLASALLWAWPQILVWPVLLYSQYPAAFDVWWQHQVWAPFGGFAGIKTGFAAGYYLENLLWFAFPAWPLAMWTASRTRLHDQPWGVLCLAWLGLVGTALTLMPDRFQDWLLLLLPPLCLLGSAKLDALRRGAAAFLNWFGIATFGLLAVFVWVGFAAINYGWPAKLAERAVYFSPYYRTDIDYFPLLAACLLTPLWLWAITRKHIRGRQAVTNWAAGITLVWALLLTLFLPWLDAAKSQRPVVQQLQQTFEPDTVAALQEHRQCVSVATDNRAARIAFAQYGWLKLDAGRSDCHYRLVSRHPRQTEIEAGWREIAAAARPREKRELWSLQQRLP